MTGISLWAGRWALGLLAAGAAGGLAAYAAYRAIKLDTLKPRQLTRQLDWCGPDDAGRKLLLLGDSRIAYWPLTPRQGWRIGRLGFSGITAVNIQTAAAGQVAKAAADIVVIQAGGNDATAAVFQKGAVRAATLARAADAVIAMGEQARRGGASRVIVLTLVPPIAPVFWKRLFLGARQTRLMLELGETIARQARARRMEVLDADRLFRDDHGALKQAFRKDGIHWSPAAYRDLDHALWSLIGQG
ncbi:MAG TPA: SGNH/GDSL hydrolase family protein [Rhizomicrobium sp.]|nr:SGNH/GDSL hydrolase family protein [Rhizomicrobium sp.]